MTELTLNSRDIISIIKQVTSDMRSHIDELRELDATAGDGDLGITVELGCNSLSSFLESATEDDVGLLLAKCSFNLNKACPSTFGTLLSSALFSASQPVRNKHQVSLYDLVSMGNGTIEGIKKRGGAEIGDKTMLDSLVPAVKSFEQALEGESNDVLNAFQAAVLAARKGMQATVNMKAKFGRAAWRPDGSVGMYDAGAAAMCYIIESLMRRLLPYIENDINFKG